MDTEDIAYFRALWARREKTVRLNAIGLVTYSDGSRSEPAKCHQNVDLWLAHHPRDYAVRGWVLEIGDVKHGRWAAHSVVQRSNGDLADVTLSDPFRLLMHEGDEATFTRLREAHPSIWLPLN